MDKEANLKDFTFKCRILPLIDLFMEGSSYMKKVIKSYYERLQPVLLFFEDIKELYEIFQEASSQITIQSNGYEFDNLDDLTKLKKEIVYDIEILCLEPYISLKMEPRNIHLYVAEDSLSSRGVFEKLKSILNNRRKKLTWLTHSPIPPGILMGSAILYFPLFDLLNFPSLKVSTNL